MEKTYGNELPEKVVRLGNKIIINLNPKQVAVEDGVLWEYDSITIAHNTPKHVIDSIIAENQPDTLKRKKRDEAIQDFTWRIERNTQELELGIIPTDNRESLLLYVQYLRDLPLSEGFPEIDILDYGTFLTTL